MTRNNLQGKHMGPAEQYQITERWRGVEQTLEPYSKILDIWNTWGSAQAEVCTYYQHHTTSFV